MNKSNAEKLSMYLSEADHAGYTPLLTAVFYNSKECVQSLFDQEKASFLFELFRYQVR